MRCMPTTTDTVKSNRIPAAPGWKRGTLRPCPAQSCPDRGRERRSPDGPEEGERERGGSLGTHLLQGNIESGATGNGQRVTKQKRRIERCQRQNVNNDSQLM